MHSKQVTIEVVSEEQIQQMPFLAFELELYKQLLSIDPCTTVQTNQLLLAGSVKSTPEACEQCTRPCEKPRACEHACPLSCHQGPCPTCMVERQEACHCGRSMVPVLCHQLQQVCTLCPCLCLCLLYLCLQRACKDAYMVVTSCAASMTVKGLAPYCLQLAACWCLLVTVLLMQQHALRLSGTFHAISIVVSIDVLQQQCI